MNKKELLEIKKQFKPENCALTRIAGCYVNGEKEIESKFKDAFLSTPEEEMFKYFDLFRKGLSGKIGKTLHNMEFPAKEQDHRHKLLMALKTERLTNDDTLDNFYDAVIENYSEPGNFLILIVHGAYDVPGKSSEGEEEQWSEEVYEHILCLMCPVSLDKPSLVLKDDKSNLQCKIRNWVIEMPKHAFLFPAFDDRRENVHGMLFYTKKHDDLQESFLDSVFGVEYLRPDIEQKEAMAQTLEATDINFEQMGELKNKLYEFEESSTENVIHSQELEKICKASGINADGVADMLNSQACKKVVPGNVIDTEKTTVETGEVTVKVKNENLDYLEFKEIDGKTYLMIKTNGKVMVDGITVTPGK